MRWGYCQYHRRKEELCKAHILPNAFYRRLAREGADGFWITEVSTARVRRTPGGLYDPNILCRAADAQFGRYDQYALSLFSTDVPATIFITPDGREWAKILKYDFQTLSLFLPSYIWRCHHSTLAPYKSFELGNVYSDRILEVLHDQRLEQITWLDYMITMFYGKRDDLSLPIKFPSIERVDGLNFAFLYFFNFKVIAKIDRRPTPSWLKLIAAKPQIPLTIPVMAYASSPERRNDLAHLRAVLSRGASW